MHYETPRIDQDVRGDVTNSVHQAILSPQSTIQCTAHHHGLCLRHHRNTSPLASPKLLLSKYPQYTIPTSLERLLPPTSDLEAACLYPRCLVLTQRSHKIHTTITELLRDRRLQMGLRCLWAQ